MPAESLARTDPSVASSPRATTEHPTINFASSPRVRSEHATIDLASVRILDRAALAPLPKFATRPFAISWVTIRTLAWADLPLNGRALLGLKFGAGTDSDGIAYKVIDGRSLCRSPWLRSYGTTYRSARRHQLLRPRPSDAPRALPRDTHLATPGAGRRSAATRGTARLRRRTGAITTDPAATRATRQTVPRRPPSSSTGSSRPLAARPPSTGSA